MTLTQSSRKHARELLDTYGHKASTVGIEAFLSLTPMEILVVAEQLGSDAPRQFRQAASKSRYDDSKYLSGFWKRQTQSWMWYAAMKVNNHLCR